MTATASEQLGENASLVKDWAKGYESQLHEYSYWIDEIEGTIPPELQGTLFRNGAGSLEVNGQKIGHPFDGDGMICAITSKVVPTFKIATFAQKAFSKNKARGRSYTEGLVPKKREVGWRISLTPISKMRQTPA